MASIDCGLSSAMPKKPVLVTLEEFEEAKLQLQAGNQMKYGCSLRFGVSPVAYTGTLRGSVGTILHAFNSQFNFVELGQSISGESGVNLMGFRVGTS